MAPAIGGWLWLWLWLWLGVVGVSRGARLVGLESPTAELFVDETEIIRLAEDEKFMLPLNTRTISSSIEYSPLNNNECTFKPPSITFSSQAEADLLTNPDESISAVLTLPKKEKVFVTDSSFNLVSYSLDKHFLLRKLSPKTALQSNTVVSSCALVATDDEQYVYYLTPHAYFVFSSDSLADSVITFPQLAGSLADIQKAILFGPYIIVASQDSGLTVYKIDRATHELMLLQQISTAQASPASSFVDMQVDRENELLYLLDRLTPRVTVFRMQPSEFPARDKSFALLHLHDEISLESITNKHAQSNPSTRQSEHNQLLGLAISHHREQQSLLVLFAHNRHSVVAEVSYSPEQRLYWFVRYYKFSMLIHSLLVFHDIFLVVGYEVVGLFPFGISPTLIPEEFNGFIQMTAINRVAAVDSSHFLAITKDTLQLAELQLQKQGGLSCSINGSSTLRTIKFKANLTSCATQDRLVYEKYCAYEKTFMIERMDLAVSAPMADSLWVSMIVFLLLILAGICVMFLLHKKRQRAIRRLELYFDDKKKHQPQPDSDRHNIVH